MESGEFLTIHFQPEQNRVQEWCQRLMSVSGGHHKLFLIGDLNSKCYRDVQQELFRLTDRKEFKACLILQLLSKYHHPFPQVRVLLTWSSKSLPTYLSADF